MNSRASVDHWADEVGFLRAVKFAGSKSAVGGKAGERYSGFYVLYFSDDTYYLGESVDLRSRMGGHARSWGDEISDVRFLRQALSKQQLRTVERGLMALQT